MASRRSGPGASVLRASARPWGLLARQLPGVTVVVFDRDLRVVLAAGPGLDARPAGADRRATGTLTAAHRAALRGRETTLEVLDPASGRRLAVAVGPLVDEAGHLVGGVETSRDVTDERPVPTVRRRTDGRLRTYLDRMPPAVLATDARGLGVFASAGWTRLTGRPAQRLAGTRWVDVVAAPDAGRIERAWTRALRGGEAFSAELHVTGPAGDPIAVAAEGRPLDDGGQLVVLTDRSRAAARAGPERRLAEHGAALVRLGEVSAGPGAADGLLALLATRVADVLAVDVLAVLVQAGPDLVVRAVHGLDPALVGSAPEAAGALAGDGLGSRLTVPFALSGGRRAALVLGRRSGAVLGPAAVELFERAAEHVAGVVDRVLAPDGEDDPDAAVQRSLLPERLPVIPGVTLAARYRPADVGVGGDFYDAFRVDAHRWLVVVGDVAGKGPEAAVLTALARYTLRAEALHESRPAELLGLLNDAIIVQHGDDRYCAVACLLLDGSAGAGRMRATIADAGLPLPLVARADGTVEEVGHLGRALGVVGDAQLQDEAIALEPGDVLLLHTDGLTEAQAPDRLMTARDVAAPLARLRGEPPALLVAELERRLLAAVHGPARDDLAVVAVRVDATAPVPARQAPAPAAEPGPSAPERVVAFVPADADVAARLRRVLRRLPGLTGDERDRVLVLVDDLVGRVAAADGLPAGALVGVLVAVRGTVLRGEVSTTGDSDGAPLTPGDRVRSLADRTGSDRDAPLRRVWFELDR